MKRKLINSFANYHPFTVLICPYTYSFHLALPFCIYLIGARFCKGVKVCLGYRVATIYALNDLCAIDFIYGCSWRFRADRLRTLAVLRYLALYHGWPCPPTKTSKSKARACSIDLIKAGTSGVTPRCFHRRSRRAQHCLLPSELCLQGDKQRYCPVGGMGQGTGTGELGRLLVSSSALRNSCPAPVYSCRFFSFRILAVSL